MRGARLRAHAENVQGRLWSHRGDVSIDLIGTGHDVSQGDIPWKSVGRIDHVTGPTATAASLNYKQLHQPATCAPRWWITTSSLLWGNSRVKTVRRFLIYAPVVINARQSLMHHALAQIFTMPSRSYCLQRARNLQIVRVKRFAVLIPISYIRTSAWNFFSYLSYLSGTLFNWILLKIYSNFK